MDDVSLWRHACPVTARRDPDMGPIRLLRESMPADEFMRECLGWWDEATGDGPITLETWTSLKSSTLTPAANPVFAFDVAPGQDRASIVAAGDVDGRMQVEVTGVDGVLDSRAGVDWLPARMAHLQKRFPSARFSYAARSAAEALVPDLASVGVRVDRVQSMDVPAACAAFYNACVYGQLMHIGQRELTDSVMRLRRKTIGEAAFKWVRSDVSQDITAAYAASLALWRAQTRRDVTQLVW